MVGIKQGRFGWLVEHGLRFAGFAIVGLASGIANAELYVTLVGDGTTTLSSAAAQASILKFTDSGTPDGTIAIPTTPSGTQRALTLGGTATSIGFLTASTDGNYLLLGGFDAAVGTAAVAGTTSATVNRVVGRITVNSGAVDTSTAFTDTSYSGDNIRSVASTNGTDLWIGGTASGTNGGVRYATFGSNTSVRVAPTPTNARVVNIFNGNLFTSSGSTGFVGVNAVGTGLPTAADGATTAPVIAATGGTGTSSPYDYWQADANTMYIADDRTAANGGGIQKWTFDSGSSTWSLAYTLGVGAGARGLAGTISAGTPVLYATTADNPSRVVSITDSGASSVFTTLATAATNTQFRGIEFVAGGVTPPNFLASDYNHDGQVNGTDLATWSTNYGAGTTNAQGDGTADGAVDGGDFVKWQREFGMPQPPVAAAIGAVPEPATIGLGLAALAMLAGLKRRAS